jgi:hypothetical protein
MNREKYPGYFLAVCILYAIIFLAMFSFFIVPSLGFGFAFAEFSVITLLFFAPMILLVMYELIPHFELLWGKERIFRALITAFTVVDFFIALFLMMLLV